MFVFRFVLVAFLFVSCSFTGVKEPASQGWVTYALQGVPSFPVHLRERLALIYSDLIDDKGKVRVEGVFLGSGVFVSEGKVLTARHVVEARDYLGSGRYVPRYVGFIKSFDGREYVLGRLRVRSYVVSEKTDLALITVEPREPSSSSSFTVGGLKVAPLNPLIGTYVQTLTAPYGEITYSYGIVHSYARITYASDALRILIRAHWHPQDGKPYSVFTLGHNLSVGPGSSGGGMFLVTGELVGIHVASTREGRLGYAITATEIREFIDAFKD